MHELISVACSKLDCALAVGGAIDPQTGNCWFVLAEELTFDGAISGCEQYEGSTLASIYSEEENNFVYNNLLDPCSDWKCGWIGLTDINDPFGPGSWVQPEWADGSTYQGSFTNWAIGQPNNISGDQYCAHFYGNQYWQDTSCSNAQQAVCVRRGMKDMVPFV